MGRLTDRPDMTLDVYRGRKTTIQQQQQRAVRLSKELLGAFLDIPEVKTNIVTSRYFKVEVHLKF